MSEPLSSKTTGYEAHDLPLTTDALASKQMASPECPGETFTYEDALHYFEEYFVQNYPGPNTIISDPKWHAPKVFRAALNAIRAASHPRPAEGKKDGGAR